MRTQTAKVNKHVHWITATGKMRPATITGVTSQSVVNLRIGHAGGTVVGANKQTADNQVSVWRFANAYLNT